MAGRGAVAPWHTSRKETTYTVAFGGKKKGRQGPQHTLTDTTAKKRRVGLLYLAPLVGTPRPSGSLLVWAFGSCLRYCCR